MSTHSDDESSALSADSTDHNKNSPPANVDGSSEDQDKLDSVTTYSRASEDPNLLGEGNEASTAATQHICAHPDLKTKFAQTQTTEDLCPACSATANIDVSKTRVYTSVYPAHHYVDRSGGYTAVHHPPVPSTPVVHHPHHQQSHQYYAYPSARYVHPSARRVEHVEYPQAPAVYQASNRVYVNPFPQLTPGTVVRTTERAPVGCFPCFHTDRVRYGQVVGYEYLDLPTEAPWTPLAFWFRGYE